MDGTQIEQQLLHLLQHIDTWDSLYDWFDKQVAYSLDNPHPAVLYGTVFALHGFMQAMRELPDEGDIQVLVRRMAFNLAYESWDKFRAQRTTLSPIERRKHESVTQEVYDSLLDNLRRHK